MRDILILKCENCGRRLKLGSRDLELILSGRAKCPSCGKVVGGQELPSRRGALLKTVRQDDIAVATFTSSTIVDAAYVQQLVEELNELIEKHHLSRIILNFDKITSMTSSVLNALIAFQHKLDTTKGELRLCNINPAIHEVFEVTALNKFFRIDESVGQAIKGLLAGK